MSITERSKAVGFLYTADVDRSMAWYRDVLGATVRDRDDYGAFLESAGALLRVTALPDFTPSEHPVAGWEVLDLAKVGEALRGHGVHFTVYEGLGQDEGGIVTSADGGRMAWFSDPDGNVLMLSQQAVGTRGAE